ncbi:MAG: tetratricopeptide repeat protein, partial [Paludibacteraceae bacterium]|nr:tetratricopeptide repeat protein [Paludibacteraceae bacterium]
MKKVLYIFVIGLIITGCSTRKNTGATRAYHQMCTDYNVGFNAKNAYIEGQKLIDKGAKDDFTQLIEMYPISYKENQTVATSQMERTIEKCRKAIKKHSITKKPKLNLKKRKEPKYQYFYSQEEFVHGVKEAWILLGKAELHKGDFLGAASTFGYIQRHYPSDPEIVCEARIWQARAYGEMDWVYEAWQVFDQIKENDVVKRLNSDYAEVKAFLLLKDKNYKEAIPYLQLATKRENNKYLSSRFNYLLGQLYLEQNQIDKATESFKLAVRQSQTYPMEFNARLMMLQCNDEAWAKNVKKLKRMAKNSNNKDFKDQIYTIVGNIYLNHKDTAEAIEAYKTAIEESTRGGVEKAAVLITLGDLYYSQKEYIDAHPCYQEASGILNAEYPDYKRVMKLGEALGELAVNYNTVELQDSLQHLSTLTEEEQLKIVEKIIEEVKKEEEEAARLAKEAETKGFEESTRPSMSMPTLGGAKDWYFYNQQLKTQGAQQFKQKWGKRVLEDNWRRANKVSTAPSMDEGLGTENEELDENGEPIAVDEPKADDGVPAHHKPEYYLSQIPKDSADIAASNVAIADALYAMAVIYDEKLNDLPMSLETYQEFQRRFAKDSRELEGYYSSYRICGKLENNEEQEAYRQRIITEYPESKYAAVLSQPDYLERTKEMLALQDSLYADTYLAYSKGNFNTVFANYDNMATNYSMSSLMPKFAFLNALSIGKTQPEKPFYQALTELVEKYPQSDVTPMCKDILALMSQGREAQQGTTHGSILEKREELAQEEMVDEELKNATFSSEKKTPHYLLLIPRNENVNLNSLLYDLAAFNFTKFMVKDYELAKRSVGG